MCILTKLADVYSIYFQSTCTAEDSLSQTSGILEGGSSLLRTPSGITVLLKNITGFRELVNGITKGGSNLRENFCVKNIILRGSDSRSSQLTPSISHSE